MENILNKEKRNIKKIIIILSGMIILFLVYGFYQYKYFWNTNLTIDKLRDNTKEDYIKLKSLLNQNIPTNLYNYIEQLNGNLDINNKNFELALKAFDGESSIDYYNRGTIKLLFAYNEGIKDNLSGLEKSKVLIEESLLDFEIAEKIKLNNNIDEYIIANKNIGQEIDSIISIKSCFISSQNTILDLGKLIGDIDNLKKILDSEYQILKNQKEEFIKIFGKECYNNMMSVLLANQKNTLSLKRKIKDYKRRFSYDLLNKTQDPQICLNKQSLSLKPIIYNAKESIYGYQKDHVSIVKALKNKDGDSILRMCIMSKDDSEIHDSNKLNNSLEQLMNNMENELSEKEESQKQNGGDINENQEGSGENQNNDQSGQEKSSSEQSNNSSTEGEENKDTAPLQSNGEIEYKDVLNENEKDILNKTNSSGEDRIEEMQEIKDNTEYNGETYLKELFKKFFGNDGDFSDLNKEGNSESNTKSR